MQQNTEIWEIYEIFQQSSRKMLHNMIVKNKGAVWTMLKLDYLVDVSFPKFRADWTFHFSPS